MLVGKSRIQSYVAEHLTVPYVSITECVFSAGYFMFSIDSFRFSSCNCITYFVFISQTHSSVKAALLVLILHQTCVNCVKEVERQLEMRASAKPLLQRSIMAMMGLSGNGL